MHKPKNTHYDELDRIVPDEAIEVATKPEVKKLSHAHRAVSMVDRVPLETARDEMGNKWEVVAAFSTDPEDIEGSRVTAIARNEQGEYGFAMPDGHFEVLDSNGNRNAVFEGENFALGAHYDEHRDSLAIDPEVGNPNKNGYDLIETMAMFEAAKSA